MSKILILEPQESLRELYRDELERQGYAVILGEPSAAELHEVDRASPDLVILDIGREEPNGLEAMRRLMDRCPRIPVLVVVARPPVREGYVSEHADAYVDTPADAHALSRTVRTLLSPEAG